MGTFDGNGGVPPSDLCTSMTDRDRPQQAHYNERKRPDFMESRAQLVARARPVNVHVNDVVRHRCKRNGATEQLTLAKHINTTGVGGWIGHTARSELPHYPPPSPYPTPPPPDRLCSSDRTDDTLQKTSREPNSPASDWLHVGSLD